MSVSIIPFSGGGVHRGVVQLLPIRGVACRGLTVKEWNHRVGGGAGVVPVIGQYLGLRCFGIVEWPERHFHCPRNLFTVLTASSARPLDWGCATEDSLCLTHHVLKNSWNMLEVKGGPPLIPSLSGAPYVRNRCQQMDINLVVVA